MKCENAEKLILLRDSAELSEGKARDVERHLTDCASCRKFHKIMVESANLFPVQTEPSVPLVQAVKRSARVNAPTRKRLPILVLKPAVAMAAGLVIALGIFFSNTTPSMDDGMVLMVTDTQMLEPEDQVVSIMYEGLSEDDLAFNFLMTYEGDAEG